VMYLPGPDRDDIQRTTQRPVHEVQIHEQVVPGKDRLTSDRLELYRPSIRKDLQEEKRTVPQRLFKLDELNQPIERKTRNRTDTYQRRDTREPQVRPSNRQTWKSVIIPPKQEETKTPKKSKSRTRDN
jgi:hypothetical protein